MTRCLTLFDVVTVLAGSAVDATHQSRRRVVTVGKDTVLQARHVVTPVTEVLIIQIYVYDVTERFMYMYLFKLFPQFAVSESLDHTMCTLLLVPAICRFHHLHVHVPAHYRSG